MSGNVQASVVSGHSRVKHLTDTLLNFVFPPVCANCKKVGKLLCADCIGMMPWLREPLCPRCGRIVAHPVARCHVCRQRPLPLQQVRAAVLFADPVPEIIHKMKYNGLFALAQPLAELMVEAWPRWQTPVDLILPIPLHPEREKKRGYNQSDLLVQHLCRRLNLPGDAAALQRIRHTQSQVGLGAQARQTNVAGAFWADADKVKGKRVLLVDDVCTTGSTLTAAAEALLVAGAKTIAGYCVARAA